MENYKVLCAIPATGSILLDGIENELNPEDWYDFELSYNGNSYVFSMETMIGFEKENGCVEYVRSVFDSFTDWMHIHKFDTSKELSMYDVFTTGLNINSEFEDIETAYATFKLLVNGFNGKGLFVANE